MLLHPTTQAAWRSWLAAHHDRETEIWLVYNKRHTGEPRRFARMVAEGKMTAAGLAKSPPEDAGGFEAKPPEDDAVPGYIEAALRANGAAWTNFSNFAPSYRRLYVRWIEDAKREETRRKRLAEAVGLLAQNKKLGLK